MSHLDTAYQIGMKQAEVDFSDELSKAAQGGLQGTAPPSQNNLNKIVPGGDLRTAPQQPAPRVPLQPRVPTAPPAPQKTI